LIGSETLMGREVRDCIGESHLPIDLKLISTDDEKAGTLTEQGGEPTVMLGFGPGALRDSRIVFLADLAASTQKALAMLGDMPAGDLPILIDLTHAAEDHPQSLIRAPFVEPADFEIPAGAVHSIAHPAAIATAMVLPRLHAQYPIMRAVIHIFEPASERGQAGILELQEQTVSLLSFKSMPKKVFDQQLSFNMLARYGDDAPLSLDTAELRIERHLATLLSRLPRTGAAPVLPSLRLVQAPVFHGYSMSLWVEFGNNPGVEAVESALVDAHIDVRGSDLEPPTSTGAAGQSGIAIGGVAMDRNAPQACWLWLTADNLRLAAENAVAVARQFL